MAVGQTKTYMAVIPELGREGMVVYQIVALCGTSESLTRKMKDHMSLFGNVFQGIEDEVFWHNPKTAMFHDWSQDSFRPTSDLHPRIVKTTHVGDYGIVSERLRNQCGVSEMSLIEGDDALSELRGVVELLEQGDEDLFNVYYSDRD